MEAYLFGLVQDGLGVAHAYRRGLTLCGEWVDAGRWAPTGMRFESSPDVSCELCQTVLERERLSAGAV